MEKTYNFNEIKPFVTISKTEITDDFRPLPLEVIQYWVEEDIDLSKSKYTPIGVLVGKKVPQNMSKELQ